jgi:hypothetical protein
MKTLGTTRMQGFRVTLTGLMTALLLLSTGCLIQRYAVRSTASVVQRGLGVFYDEPDRQVAETALIANLKLLEALLPTDPNNKPLRLLLSQGYYAYALAFIEDKDPERARRFYLRGRDFALAVLRQDRVFDDSLKMPADEFAAGLNRLGKNKVEPLFWCAINWGNWIMLNLEDPQAIFDLARVEAMMRRVLALDESFFFAGSHVFLGGLLAAKPVILGGKPDQAKLHFERAIELTGGRFLLSKVYFARFYAVQTGNRELFSELLHSVVAADPAVLPGYQLISVVAQEKARNLLQKEDDLF